MKRLLRGLWQAGRLPHAFLFFGPAGVGKEAAAIELARTLNCSRGEWDACGECPDCRQMATLRHPRLKLVFPLPAKENEKTAIDRLSESELEQMNEQIDAKAADPYHRIEIPKAQGIKISSIRDIRRESAFKASTHGRTVVVICEADRMNPHAANALLKTLEEPDGGMLLILTTAKRDALLPTITSRCQHVRFDPLSEDQIAKALVRRYGTTPEAAATAARVAGGNLREAVSLATGGSMIPRSEIVEFLRAIFRMEPIGLMKRIESYAATEDRRAVMAFLTGIAGWFRDVLALHEGTREQVRNTDLMEPLEKFAEHFPRLRCSDAIDAVEEAIDHITRNAHLTTVLIVLSHRIRRCMDEDTA
ncbi:MAG: DNA polymerase III subunit delta' [Bacteroidota bacterium]|nr:DNA polymerase III subunit delta' [Bacteroidota bacterium]